MPWQHRRRSISDRLRRCASGLGVVLLSILVAPVAGRSQEADAAIPKEKIESLMIQGAVVCRSIEGFEDYEVLPDAELTSDEKLLIYYRPRGYAIVRDGDDFSAKFTQDGRIRFQGKNAVLQKKDKLLDYEAIAPRPPREIYLRNTVSLKGLRPGDYEYEMILYDENAERASTTATVKFRIIPVSRTEPAK